MQWLEPFATDNVVRLENATVKGRKINFGALGSGPMQVVLWNIPFTCRRRCHIFCKSGETPEEEHLARLSPLIHAI